MRRAVVSSVFLILLITGCNSGSSGTNSTNTLDNTNNSASGNGGGSSNGGGAVTPATPVQDLTFKFSLGGDALKDDGDNISVMLRNELKSGCFSYLHLKAENKEGAVKYTTKICADKNVDSCSTDTSTSSSAATSFPNICRASGSDESTTVNTGGALMITAVPGAVTCNADSSGAGVQVNCKVSSLPVSIDSLTAAPDNNYIALVDVANTENGHLVLSGNTAVIDSNLDNGIDARHAEEDGKYYWDLGAGAMYSIQPVFVPYGHQCSFSQNSGELVDEAMPSSVDLGCSEDAAGDIKGSISEINEGAEVEFHLKSLLFGDFDHNKFKAAHADDAVDFNFPFSISVGLLDQYIYVPYIISYEVISGSTVCQYSIDNGEHYSTISDEGWHFTSELDLSHLKLRCTEPA